MMHGHAGSLSHIPSLCHVRRPYADNALIEKQRYMWSATKENVAALLMATALTGCTIYHRHRFLRQM